MPYRGNGGLHDKNIHSRFSGNFRKNSRILRDTADNRRHLGFFDLLNAFGDQFFFNREFGVLVKALDKFGGFFRGCRGNLL